MEKEADFQKYLDKATKSVRRSAARKKRPYAVSVDGVVKLIYPDKSEEVVEKVSS
jgi:hypothetical protein